jgi:general secretion pathway protein D
MLAGVGNEITVRIFISQAGHVGSVPFHIAYDPKILQFENGAEGDFLKKDGASTVFNAQASTLNEVFVALARLGVPTGADGDGTLCTLKFKALAPGKTALTFTEASLLDAGGQLLPAAFAMPMQVDVQQGRP